MFHNNITMTKINLLLLTIALLINYCTCTYTLEVVGPITKSAFTCLLGSVDNELINKVSIRGYQNSRSPPGIDPNALSTLNNALDAQYLAYVYIEVCRGENATAQIDLVNDTLITPLANYPGLSEFLIIKIQPTVNSYCNWKASNKA
jgi:hypothetical protein